MCETVCLWVCMCTCLKCAAAKSDRTQAHISLPRERYKGTHTHTGLVSSLSNPISPTLYLRTLSVSNSDSTHTYTSTHAHLALPKGRGGWWINNGTPPIVSPAWALISTAVPAPHSSASCLSACWMLPCAYTCAHTFTRIFNILFMSLSHTETCIRLYGPTYTLSFSYFLLTKSLSVSFCPSILNT